MTDSVEQIKSRLSIVDVIAPYVKLTKSGKHYKGLSPFNKEKTPSFFVSVERGSYYCFSTNQGGDMFSFIQKMEGVDFKGSLKILAEKAGVSLGTYAPKDTTKVDALRGALEKARASFIAALTKDTEAYAYAVNRGLSSETIQAWGLGYARDGWRTLLEEMTNEGTAIDTLANAGLIKEAEEKKGTWYDRFRNRLMFPIYDSSGRVVAFTGRALDPGDQAKYLNSPETDVFKKSEVLYGFDRAKDSIRKRGFAILTEGQFDVILLHQIGFSNTVALSGTAFTPMHVSLVMRYTDNLMLALDSDRAGRSATYKHASTALGSGMRVKVIDMPLGKDPADMAHENPADFTKRVKEARHVINFFIDVITIEEKDSHRLLRKMEEFVLPLIALIKSPIEQEHFMKDVAQALSVSVEAVRESMPKNDGTQKERINTDELPAADKRSVLDNRFGMYMALYLAHPETPLAKMLEKEYTRITGQPLPTQLSSERLLFEADIAYGDAPSEGDIQDVIKAFEKEYLNNRLAQLSKELSIAERERDNDKIDTLLSESTHITTLLTSL